MIYGTDAPPTAKAMHFPHMPIRTTSKKVEDFTKSYPNLFDSKGRLKPYKQPEPIHKKPLYNYGERNRVVEISDGKKLYPNSYCLVPIGKTDLCYHLYARHFPKGTEVYTDEIIIPEKREGVTGRHLLQRFYDLNPRPIAIKLVKDKDIYGIRQKRFIVVYPMHFIATMDFKKQEDDHECSLYFRDYAGHWHEIAQQTYEGLWPANEQDGNLIGQFKEWREMQIWFQGAQDRDRLYDVIPPEEKLVPINPNYCKDCGYNKCCCKRKTRP